MVLQDVVIFLHRVSKRFLSIVFKLRTQIVGFPIHQIELILVPKNQVHITFHETSGGTEDQFLQPAWKIPDTLYAVISFENGSQFLGSNRIDRKVKFHLVDSVFESN